MTAVAQEFSTMMYTVMITQYSARIATTITTQDVAAVMPCSMKMMHIISMMRTTAESVTTMNVTDSSIFTNTDTNPNQSFTAVQKDILALSWKLTVPERIVNMPKDFLTLQI